jgi:hypothetical protein
MLGTQDSCKLVIPGTNPKNQDSLDGRFASLQLSPTMTGQSLARPGQSVGEKSTQGSEPTDG